MIMLSVKSYRAAIGVFYLRLRKHVHTKKELRKESACENKFFIQCDHNNSVFKFTLQFSPTQKSY